jgi:hypothetical protein
MQNEPTNIDDLLHSQHVSIQPKVEDNYVPDDEVQSSSDINQDDSFGSDEIKEEPAFNDDADSLSVSTEEKEIDDYGNEKLAAKTYTEDEVNERINQAIRDRLARLERNTTQQQPNQAQVQQATQQGFEYNSESQDSWQQQLESFVEQTVDRMSHKQAQQAQQLREKQAQSEFETKFRSGMGKFKDFTDVVGKQPITDAMTLASRGMKDPAAFFYAASKRAPQELQRISQIPDYYVQMVEIGKLEEKMRKNAPVSGAPKPLGKIKEDSSLPLKTHREPTIEDLIAADAAKKRAAINKHRRN